MLTDGAPEILAKYNPESGVLATDINKDIENIKKSSRDSLYRYKNKAVIVVVVELRQQWEQSLLESDEKVSVLVLKYIIFKLLIYQLVSESP